jgi:pimeloyl-ACP methyl ester carboxylesterase
VSSVTPPRNDNAGSARPRSRRSANRPNCHWPGFRYDRAGIYPCEIPDADLAALRHPTLLIVGDHERIFDPSAAVARARRLFGDIETELLPGVGHLPNLQRPEIVNQHVRRFLDLRFPRNAVPVEVGPEITVLVRG